MVETTAIYLDLKRLRKLLKQAQVLMTKPNRIIYGTPALVSVTTAIQSYILAYEMQEDKRKYAKRLIADIVVVRLEVEDMFEENVIQGTDSNTGLRADTLKMRIVEALGLVDKGAGRYISSIIKGKTVTNA